MCLLAGCAAEAPPRPPRIQNPQAVNDFSAAQTGRTVTISFKTPARATDGRDLTKPLEVEIFRNLAPSGRPAAPAFVAARPWVHIGSGGLTRFERGPLFVYAYTLSPRAFAAELGDTLSFTVVTLTRSFRGRARESAPSNIVRIELLNVSPAIQDLRIIQSRGALHLQWSAPAHGLAQRPMARLAGYRIYRGEGNPPASMNLLAETPGASYNDTQFRFGHRYAYSVRAVFKQGQTTAESAGSMPVEITPRKIFPPPPPAGLMGIYTGRAVELIWNSVPGPDLAGYNVYRRLRGAPARRLNQRLLPTPAFEDASAKPGHKYEYWVTAVDQERNESRPSASVTVATR
ncbi:MAG: fibronectin type III domain-containing protein [Terriglobia bacterium]